MKQRPAVVLGMGPTSLCLVRALGRKGVLVYGVGLNPYEVSLSSKYCRALGAIDPRYNPEGLLALLIRFGKKFGSSAKPVLYPTGDECVVFMSAYAKALSMHFVFSNVNEQLIEILLNKAKFYEICQQYDFATPPTYLPQNRDDLIAISETISFPCIIKPKYYHDWAMKHGLKKVVFCQDRNDYAKGVINLQENADQVIVQEVIEGPESDIYVVAGYFDKKSNPHGLFSGRKIRQYPVGFGTTTKMETVDMPDLIKQSVRFLKKIKYDGLVDIEFKYDRKTETFYVIEINPRLGRWYGIVEAAGHDSMYYSYLDLTGQTIPGDQKRSTPVVWSFVVRDVLAIAGSRNRHFRDVIQSYRGPRTWCIWSNDDIKPVFAYFLEMIFKAVWFLDRRRQPSGGQDA